MLIMPCEIAFFPSNPSYLSCSFKRLCEDAFLKMRDRGPLFLNLFTMMLSCGIPELRTRADISYIRWVILTRTCCADSMLLMSHDLL